MDYFDETLTNNILTEQETLSDPSIISLFHEKLSKNKYILFEVEITKKIQSLFSFQNMIGGKFIFHYNGKYIRFYKLIDASKKEIKINVNHVNEVMFLSKKGGRIVFHKDENPYHIISPSEYVFYIPLMKKRLTVNFKNDEIEDDIFKPKNTLS